MICRKNHIWHFIANIVAGDLEIMPEVYNIALSGENNILIKSL